MRGFPPNTASRDGYQIWFDNHTIPITATIWFEENIQNIQNIIELMKLKIKSFLNQLGKWKTAIVNRAVSFSYRIWEVYYIYHSARDSSESRQPVQFLFERISPSSCDEKGEMEIITKCMLSAGVRCMFARLKIKLARRTSSVVFILPTLHRNWDLVNELIEALKST